jgi:hypothetical protein
MDRVRVAIAVLALAVPAVVFAFNAFISYRERTFVEPYDIPAAIAFLVVAVLVWQRSTAAVVGGVILCAIYLATVVASGPAVFTAYWVFALLATLQAVALQRAGGRST